MKTVARYSKLDDQDKAEYFLIGSLVSIFWAVVMTGAIAIYDRTWGADLLSLLAGLFATAPAQPS